MELDRRGAELLFQVLTEREEKTAVAIASNEAFSGWTKTFTDPRLCAAIVDRLTFGGNIIETGTNSYRLAHARAQRQPVGPLQAVTLGPLRVDTATHAVVSCHDAGLPVVHQSTHPRCDEFALRAIGLDGDGGTLA